MMNQRRTTRLRTMRTALVENPLSPPEASNAGEVSFVKALASVLHEQDFSAALQHFEQARKLFESPVDKGQCLLEEAHIHTLLGRNGQAVKALEQALKTFPEAQGALRGEACYVLAKLLARMARFQAALDYHLASKAYYEHKENLDLADFHGFETWIREQMGDYKGWARAVKNLMTVNPDKLALHRIPPNTAKNRARCNKITAGLEALMPEAKDNQVIWYKALQAMTLYISRRTQEAFDLLLPLSKLSNDPLTIHLLGKCHMRLQDPKTALSCFLSVRDQGFLYFDLLLDLAMVHEILGNYQEALEHYKRLGQLDPQQILPLAREAVLEDSLNDKLAAVDSYRRLSERDPKNRTALVRLALLNAELERDDDAQQWLERALKATGPDPTLLMTRARVLLRTGDLKQAAKDALRALELLEPLLAENKQDAVIQAPGADDAPAPAGNPEALGKQAALTSVGRLTAQTQLVLAHIYTNMKRFEDAEKTVNKVLQILPENEEAQLLRGDLARVRGEPEEAADRYKNLISTILCDSLLHDGLALSLEGRYTEALTKYRAAYEQFPKNWKVFYNAALAYTQLGQFEAAVKYLSIARKFNKDVPAMVETDPQLTPLRESEWYDRYRGETS